jgi:hypothetical protein
MLGEWGVWGLWSGDGLSQMFIQIRPYTKFQSFNVAAATGNEHWQLGKSKFALLHADKSKVSLYIVKASGLTCTNYKTLHDDMNISNTNRP